MKQSWKSKIYEYGIGLLSFFLGTKRKFYYQKYLAKQMSKTERKYRLNKRILNKYGIRYEEFAGMDCGLSKNSDNKSNLIILYLHGGTYCRPPMNVHWRFLSKLRKMSGAEIIAPIYPKAPWHQYQESFEKLTVLYKKVLSSKNDQKIILMGDSSGGGFALSFSQYLNKLGLPQVEVIIAFSPWLDITMTNSKIATIEPYDPMFSSEGLKLIGKEYAGGTDASCWMLSPINGTLDDLPNIHIFTGTRDILYPDIEIFMEKSLKQTVDINLHLFEGQIHNFQLFTTSEADQVMKETIEIINSMMNKN